jgi:hypothetical protein
LSNQCSFEDASVLQIALLPRNKPRESTPLQDFLTMMDEAFVVKNVVRNRVWELQRRTGKNE